VEGARVVIAVALPRLEPRRLAYVDESAGPDCPGLVIVGDGEGDLAGVPVEYVKVWLNGATSRLTAGKATGSSSSLPSAAGTPRHASATPFAPTPHPRRWTA